MAMTHKADNDNNGRPMNQPTAEWAIPWRLIETTERFMMCCAEAGHPTEICYVTIPDASRPGQGAVIFRWAGQPIPAAYGKKAATLACGDGFVISPDRWMDADHSWVEAILFESKT
jgi:hypothetical protein